MKWYPKFPKAPGLKFHHQMQFSDISRTFIVREKGVLQLVYSTAPGDRAKNTFGAII